MLTLSTLWCKNVCMPTKRAPAQGVAKTKTKAHRYHHGHLPGALIEAGLKLIEEKGIRALTLRGVGGRGGVSRTAAYRHFSDKAALLGAIWEAGFTQFGD